MSNYKILLKISGSIAAYKSASLISRLVQNGFEVRVVATDNALKFIGKATLEGLTGHRVYADSFEEGEMMSHINLVKWADLIIVCPASANTINKLANGVADNLLTSLFLAHDWTKPYLIAPAMNTLMYEHPATQSAIKKLTEWGVRILPTAEGYLACGDIGKGKLLEPEIIYEQILLALKSPAVKNEEKDEKKKKLKILITSGGTKENIDGIRFISNLSTGKTAAAIADNFLSNGHDVTYLHAHDAATPNSRCQQIQFYSFDDLNNSLKFLLGNHDFDVVIHQAAVSDYSLDTVELGNKKLSAPLTQKIDSENSHLVFNLKKNLKIVDHLKEYSANKSLIVVAFKFTNSSDDKKREAAVQKLFGSSNCNIVILNDQSDRNENGVQTNFRIFDGEKELAACKLPDDLANQLENLLTNKLMEK